MNYCKFDVIDQNQNARSKMFELATDSRPIKVRINCQYDDLLDKNGNQILGAGMYIELYDVFENESIPGTQDAIQDFYGKSLKIKAIQ